MKTPVKPVTLTIDFELERETYKIVAMSMIEPSTQHIRFRTTGGLTLEAHGGVIGYTGDINALPSAITD